MLWVKSSPSITKMAEKLPKMPTHWVTRVNSLSLLRYANIEVSLLIIQLGPKVRH